MPGENVALASLSTPMLLSVFHSETNRYWKIVQENESNLLDAYHIFLWGKSISPDQCRSASILIEGIGEPIQECCNLLANSALLPESVVPHRYLLLATLQHMGEQIQTLIPLFAVFRTLCKTPSRRTTKSHQEIQRKLELLVQDCHEALEHFRTLFYKAQLEERRATQFLSGQQRLEPLCGRDLYMNENREVSLLRLARALRVAKEVGDRERESNILNDLGRTYSVLGKKEVALRYFKQALAMAREVRNRREEGNVLNNLSLICSDLGYQEEAKKYLEQALSVCREVGDHLGEGRIGNTQGWLYDNLGQ